MNKKIYQLLALVIFLSLTSCGYKMLPKAERAQQVIHRHLNSYGKKYPDTVYGNKNVQSILINGIEPVSYNTVFVDTVVNYKEGTSKRHLLKMQKKFPQGWRVISWEVL